MNFADLLNPHLIICDLQVNDRESIYREMISQLQTVRKSVGQTEDILTEIIEHEALIGMPNQCGFAVPHTRSGSIDDLHIVIGIHKEGVMLKDDDLEPSKVIILCLISKATSSTYLLVLKAIFSYFAAPGNTDKMVSCNSPQEVIKQFKQDNVEIKHSIDAEDIMLSEPPVIQEDAMLKEAIDLLATTGHNQLPVVNQEQQFIGSISLESVLKAGVPDYVLMMDQVAFLSEFEPFEKLLHEEDQLPVKNYINRNPDTCSPDCHLMEIVVALLKKKALCYYVLDEQKKLQGIISKREIINNLLRR